MKGKKLICAVLCLILALSLIACTKQPTTDPTPSTPSGNDQPTTDGTPQAPNGFPSKEITVIVPWAAGGSNDVVMRKLAAIIKAQSGVNIIVENVTGGGSATGLTQAMLSKNDGYTLGMATSSWIALAAQKSVDVDLIKDETNISVIDEEAIIIAAKKGKFNGIKDFLEQAAKAPETISIGVAGSNNVNQAYATILGQAANVKFLFVPYDGSAREIPEILGGNIDAGALKYSEVAAQVEAGEMEVLVVCSDERLSVLPDVPTAGDVGYDVFTYGKFRHMVYMMGPAGMDQQIVDYLAYIFDEAVFSDEFQSYCDSIGMITKKVHGTELDERIKDVHDAFVNGSADIFGL